jgi:glycosyltransferase involved in cell wall biosynthesis
MSNSLLEAMALGLPVVATKVDGSSEVIQDGRTGRLVPAEDTQALAETVSSLLAAEDLRKEMAAAAREVVQNEFSAERSVSSFEQLYLELYEGRGRPLERKDGKTASGRT